MTTHDLTRQEFDELKESYFQQLKDTNPDVLGDITNWEELSDNFIHEHYEGWWFEREDFVCNNPQTLLD